MRRFRGLLVVLGVIVLLGAGVWGADWWMTRQGVGWMFDFRGKPLIELGVMKHQPFREEVAYPKEFTDSFTKMQQGDAVIRQPKYTQNIRILKAENGVVYAQDYTTGQPRQYQWLAGTAYSCWA